MGLDIRLPIGLMFSLLGALLVFAGVTEGRRSLGININLYWGLVVITFGAVMLFMAWRAKRADKKPTPKR
jgi:hypothetical protein